MATTVCPTLIIGSEPSGVIREFPSDVDLHFVRTGDLGRFREMVRTCFFGLLLSAGSAREMEAAVATLVSQVPSSHLVLIESEGTRSPAQLSLVSPRLAALPADCGLDLAARAVWRAWFEGQAERMRTVAREGPLPASLRCAVSKILRERMTVKNPERGEVTLCTSLTDLAERCGVSRDALLRARKRFDLDLGAMMREWRVALALREYFIEDELPSLGVWAAIGRRSGYEGESGIRGLIVRVLGVGLDELTFDQLNEVLARLHSRLVKANSG